MRRHCSLEDRSLDRFIPRRRSSDALSSHFQLLGLSCNTKGSSSTPTVSDCPENTNTPRSRRTSILNLSSVTEYNHTTSTSGSESSPMVRRGSLSTPVNANSRRRKTVPNSPDRVLDMPNLRDDIYHNAFAWSCKGTISVSLADAVYCWNADRGHTQTVSMDSDDWPADSVPVVTALTWDMRGRSLAIGMENGMIAIWDSKRDKLAVIHPVTPHEHSCEVDSLVWIKQNNDSVLYGSQSCGCIREITIAVDMLTHKVQGVVSDRFHRACRGRVSGMAVSPSSHYLAFSENRDFRIKVWNLKVSEDDHNRHMSISGHDDVVKALAFCPWQPSLLASGSISGVIKFHKVSSGVQVMEIPETSQVTCMVWSSSTRELITGHGQPDFDVRIWLYPRMEQVGSLKTHKARVLYLGMSPDCTTLASLGADEYLNLWEICKRETTPKSKERCSSRDLLLSPFVQVGSPLAACIH